MNGNAEGLGLAITYEPIPLYETLTRKQMLLRLYKDVGFLQAHLNPEWNDQPIWPMDNVWLVLFRRRYFIVIHRARSISGPHPAFLHYRCRQINRNVEIATLQVEGFFYAFDRTLKPNLLNEIKQRTLYQNPKRDDEEVPT